MKIIRYILIGFISLIIIPIALKLFVIILALVNGGAKNTDKLLGEFRGNVIILLILTAVALYLVNRNKKEKTNSKLPPKLPNQR